MGRTTYHARDYYYRHPLNSRLALPSRLGEEQKRRKGKALDEGFETFWYISSPYSAGYDDFNSGFNNVDGMKKRKREEKRGREGGRKRKLVQYGDIVCMTIH